MVSRDAIDFFQNLKQITDRTGDDLRPVQAWVVDEVAGRVRLRFGGETAAESGDQRYARNGGAPYAPDTEVMAQPVGRGWFVLGPVQRGAGTSAPSVEGSGALPGAPVFDLLAVVPASLRWQGTTRLMSSKQRAMALRMVRQFPGLLQLASGGRVGCRVRLIEQADPWDLDAAIAVGKAEVTAFGTSGSWITDQGAQSLWGTYAGRTYDSRMLFLGTSQMDSTANEITRRDFPYSFLNPEDTWYDADRAAGRVSDQMVHAFMRQIEEVLRDHGVTPTSVDSYAAAGYGVDPVRSLMPWFQQWWATADLSGLVDDGRVPDIDPRTSLVPFTRVDLDDSWGSLQGATAAIGGGDTFQRVITTYLNGALVKVNPDNIDIRSGTGISVTPGTHDGGVEYVINAIGTGAGGTSIIGNRMEWHVLIVVPRTVKYQGVTKTMTAKEWDFSVKTTEQFAALMEMTAGHVMDVRVRAVFRTAVWDLDADIAAGATPPTAFGTGGYFDQGTSHILLNSYYGDDYDAQIIYQGKSIYDCPADGLTRGWRTGPGLATIIVGDSTYDFYAGNNVLADVVVHEHNHQIEWRLQQDGVPAAQVVVDGRLPSVPETGPGSMPNPGSSPTQSRINWFDGYLAWWDHVTDFIQDRTIKFRSVPPTIHPDTVPIYNRFVQQDNGWGRYGATGGTATGDYNQSIDVYGEGLGLVSANPATLDFKAPLVVTEPSPDVIQVTVGFGGTGSATTVSRSDHTHAAADIVSGTIAPARLGTGTASATTTLYGDGTWKTAPTGGTSTTWNGGDVTAATHYRNALVDGFDSAGLRRWELNPAGAFGSYDTATGTLRATLGNGSLTLYDAAGVATVLLPTSGTAPRFATTPTVGPSGSSVPVVTTNDSRLSDARQPTAHTHVKGDVGLGSVDNTADANKPISTAQQTALNLKSDTTHIHPTTGFTPAVATGEYFGPIHQLGGTPGTQAFGGGNLYLYPVNIDRAQTWASMALRITTSAVGNIRFGIYASDPVTGMATGAPIREVVGTTTASAGVVIIGLGLNWTNAPGKYWLCWITDVSQTLQSVINNGATFSGIGSSAAEVAGTLNKQAGYGRGQAYGALPSSPVRTYTLASIPFLFLIAA